MCNCGHEHVSVYVKTFLFGEEKQLFLSLIPLSSSSYISLCLPVSFRQFGAGNGAGIPLHGRGLRRTLVARFNCRGHRSKVPPGSTFAILPRPCPDCRQSGQPAAR